MGGAEMRYAKRTVEVLGSQMAYVETGSGDPIVFLHGNPTSSYLWRNVIPHLESLGRCIAPDLIGMGDSAKLLQSGPGRYRLAEHQRHIDALLEQIGVESNVTLVVHDWGSALGFDWASRHADAVSGIAYMEAIVAPMRWEEFPERAAPVFRAFRSEAGEEMILVNNVFVERVLPGSTLRDLTYEEMAEYRRPFATPGESRRPTLCWPREIPLDGEPADVVETVARYCEWLRHTEVPKLFINAEPGALLVAGRLRALCRSFPNQREVTVRGVHFVQEDSPHEIGDAVRAWLSDLRKGP